MNKIKIEQTKEQFEAFSNAVDRLLAKWKVERLVTAKFKHLRSKNHRPNIQNLKG